MTDLILTDRVQCMRMCRIEMGLDYEITVMLTCKLLFPTAKVTVVVGPDVAQQS